MTVFAVFVIASVLTLLPSHSFYKLGDRFCHFQHSVEVDLVACFISWMTVFASFGLAFRIAPSGDDGNSPMLFLGLMLLGLIFTSFRLIVKMVPDDRNPTLEERRERKRLQNRLSQRVRSKIATCL